MRTRPLEDSRDNPLAVKPTLVSPTIDTAWNVGHDSSIRTSRLYGRRERPIKVSIQCQRTAASLGIGRNPQTGSFLIWLSHAQRWRGAYTLVPEHGIPPLRYSALTRFITRVRSLVMVRYMR